MAVPGAVGVQNLLNLGATGPKVAVNDVSPGTTPSAVGATPELVDFIGGGNFGERNARIARSLGSNWGMWLPLLGVLITALLPWWSLSLGTEYTFTRSPMSQETPNPGLNLAIIILVALTAVYLVVRDSRIGFPLIVVGDAWVALVAVVAVLPLVVQGFMGFTEGADLYQPTGVVVLTCLLAALTMSDAILLLVRARKDVPFIKRGSWVWEPSPHPAGQAGAAQPGSVSDPESRKPIAGHSCPDCGKTVTPEAWDLHQRHCAGHLSQNV